MLYVLLDHIQPVIDSSMLPLVVIHQKLREFYEPIETVPSDYGTARRHFSPKPQTFGL